MSYEQFCLVLSVNLGFSCDLMTAWFCTSTGVVIALAKDQTAQNIAEFVFAFCELYLLEFKFNTI